MKTEDVTCQACGGKGCTTREVAESRGEEVAAEFVQECGGEVRIGTDASYVKVLPRSGRVDCLCDGTRIVIRNLVNRERADAEAKAVARMKVTTADAMRIVERWQSESEAEIASQPSAPSPGIGGMIDGLPAEKHLGNPIAPSTDIDAMAKVMAEKMVHPRNNTNYIDIGFNGRTTAVATANDWKGDLIKGIIADAIATGMRQERAAGDKRVAEEREAVVWWIESAPAWSIEVLLKSIRNGEHRK